MERVEIVSNYDCQPRWKKALAVVFIYIPIIITIPFVIIGSVFIRTHLQYIGAHKLKRYRDFLPENSSYRYTLKTQIVGKQSFLNFAGSKWLWIFNCTRYCTYSIALFAYVAYLIKVVENWWCPFYHSKKVTYAESAIDKSFWHSKPVLENLLCEDDRNNPLWNQDIN